MNTPTDGTAHRTEWISNTETLIMRVLVVLVMVIAVWLARGRELDSSPCTNFWGQQITGTNVYQGNIFVCNMPQPRDGMLV